MPHAAPASPPPIGPTWRRLRVTLVTATCVFGLFLLSWEANRWHLVAQVYGSGLLALAVFLLLERWPRRLPGWMARWALQVLGVALLFPPLMVWFYWVRTAEGAPPFWQVGERLGGFVAMTMMGMLVAPWVAMVSLLRQRDARVAQAERARGEAERQALDAQLRLLQGQVQPHFLFNTLANVQALVDVGSPRAAPVLAALVAYLRAAVPRLHEHAPRLGQELEMARAYLALMQMRMPDRLQFSVQVEPGVEALRTVPMVLLTPVENAVRHGIDPSLDAGQIAVQVSLREGRCQISVSDSGVGLSDHSAGLGSGLQTLRERLALAFGDAATLQLSEVRPRGVRVDIEFPAQTA